jgi:hypothetical protein
LREGEVQPLDYIFVLLLLESIEQTFTLIQHGITAFLSSLPPETLSTKKKPQTPLRVGQCCWPPIAVGSHPPPPPTPESWHVPSRTHLVVTPLGPDSSSSPGIFHPPPLHVRVLHPNPTCLASRHSSSPLGRVERGRAPIHAAATVLGW